MTNLPPGPKLPKVIQLYQWVANPMPFFDDCAKKYGDIFTVHLPQNPPLIVTSNPEHIKEIFTAAPDDLHAGEANQLIESFVGKNSLLILDGQRHLKERRLMLPPFHGDRMQAYGDVMRDLTHQMIDRWPIGKSFSFQKEMQTLTLEIIIRTVFGVDEGERLTELRDLLAKVIEQNQHPIFLAMGLTLSPDQIRGIFDFGLKPRSIAGFDVDLNKVLPWGQISRDAKELDDFLYAEFARRRTQDFSQRTDVLSMLMSAKHEDGSLMTDEELRDEMITLLAAGHETTATSLSWALFHLSKAPDIQQKIRDDIASVTNNDLLQTQQVNKLEYVDATIKETLRIYPVIPLVARKVKKPIRLGNYEIPAGCLVTPNIYLTHRRPELFALPQKFWPDRFITKKPPSIYEYLPFGGGIRRCIGMAFASYEMKIVLTEIMRRVDFMSDPKVEVGVTRRGVVLSPSQGMPIIINSRRPKQKQPQQTKPTAN
jgi:cytochrome P450